MRAAVPARHINAGAEVTGFDGLATDGSHVMGVATDGNLRAYDVDDLSANEHYDAFINSVDDLTGVAFRGNKLYALYSGTDGRIDIHPALRDENGGTGTGERRGPFLLPIRASNRSSCTRSDG